MYLIFLFMCWKLVLTQCIVVTVLLCDAAKISESPQRSDAFVPSATVAANEALSVTTAPTESVIGSSIDTDEISVSVTGPSPESNTESFVDPTPEPDSELSTHVSQKHSVELSVDATSELSPDSPSEAARDLNPERGANPVDPEPSASPMPGRNQIVSAGPDTRPQTSERSVAESNSEDLADIISDSSSEAFANPVPEPSPNPASEISPETFAEPAPDPNSDPQRKIDTLVSPDSAVNRSSTTENETDKLPQIHSTKNEGLPESSVFTIVPSSVLADNATKSAFSIPTESSTEAPIQNDQPALSNDISTSIMDSFGGNERTISEKPLSSSPINDKASPASMTTPKSTTIPAMPKVRVTQGNLAGMQVSTGKAFVDIYLGVAYAEKPMRFSRAKEVKSWSGLKIATKKQAPCLRSSADSASEDCLYLNIWTPTRSSDLNSLIWFIGDGLLGEKASTNTDFAMFSSTENIVVFSVSYRVGPLGFLNVSVEDVYGELGLQDQALSLRWIYDNIEAFGGRKDMITIGGYGFSGATAGLHLLDPTVSELFQKVVLLSGNPLMLNRFLFDGTFKLYLNEMNCHYSDVAESLACLKAKESSRIGSELKFGPISRAGIELPECFKNHTMKDKSILLGSYARSGSKILPNIVSFLSSKEPNDKKLVTLKETIEREFGFTIASVDNRRIFRTYAPSAPADLQQNVTKGVVELVIEMNQDLLYRCPDRILAAMLTEGTPVRVFELDYPHTMPFSELPLLLDWQSLTVNGYEEQMQADLSRVLSQQIAAFIRGSTPKVPGKSEDWPLYTPDSPKIVYLQPGNVTVASLEKTERCRLWEPFIINRPTTTTAVKREENTIRDSSEGKSLAQRNEANAQLRDSATTLQLFTLLAIIYTSKH
ncbi:acetylcholinesterase-1-like isoform X2 [Varroa destructor]|uniref:Carboxylesterase type B domain-containing protein n=1 Tax=Varroa destructor TaxID=109461 RepID=A0A7M7K7K9_VARDE|nr:acetylcholinesterase-1-like isoform X2 [Varroa destructor]